MTRFSKFYSAVYVTVLLAPAFSTPSQAQMESPDVVVRSAAADVLESMEGRREYLEAHPDELRQLVNNTFLPRFDRSYAAYLVLARHGRAATADQRSRFSEALYQYILNRYAHGLLSFTSDRLQILPFEEEEGQEKATVRTFVVLNYGSRIPVNYDLRLGDAGWRVYDIAIDGISYLRNLRSQLGEEIERSGLESVITRLIADGARVEDDAA